MSFGDILDRVRGTKPKKTTDKLPRFVPVIFANGEDDDLPGLQAACKNEPVQYRDKVYEPNIPIVVAGQRLRFCHGHVHLTSQGVLVACLHDGGNDKTLTLEANGGRVVVVADCFIRIGR